MKVFVPEVFELQQLNGNLVNLRLRPLVSPGGLSVLVCLAVSLKVVEVCLTILAELLGFRGLELMLEEFLLGSN